MTLQIDIRKSRKIIGEYTLTKTLTCFDDGISAGNYYEDIHNSEGSGISHYYFKDGEWYENSYRCLIPKMKTNLLVVGRCISLTHEA